MRSASDLKQWGKETALTDLQRRMERQARGLKQVLSLTKDDGGLLRVLSNEKASLEAEGYKVTLVKNEDGEVIGGEVSWKDEAPATPAK